MGSQVAIPPGVCRAAVNCRQRKGALMPYVDNFEPCGEDSDELIGPPDPSSSGIGHIVLVYGRLDAYVSAVLIRLHHPFSRLGATRRRQSAWEEAGVLFEVIYHLVILTEDLQAFFDGP